MISEEFRYLQIWAASSRERPSALLKANVFVLPFHYTVACTLLTVSVAVLDSCYYKTVTDGYYVLNNYFL